MGSLLQCCKHCCGKDDDDEHQQHQATESAQLVHMSRGAVVARDDSTGSYQVAPQGSHDEAEGEEDGCCLPGSDVEESAHATGIREVFQRLRLRWRLHDPLAVVPDGEINESEIDPRDPFAIMKTPEKSSSPPLRQAASFDSSKEIPTIGAAEVVLPGSNLQREMAQVMSRSLERQDDECVICMEGFDASNPRMPTLCGCGQNKTYFHLPCLYQWIEQCRDCPSCRQKLRWEEF